MSEVTPVAPCEEAPFWGAPPPRTPTRVTEGMAVNGKRVIVSNEDGWWYDNRAAGPTFRDHRGILKVWVIPEADWYQWMDKPEGTIFPYDLAQAWPADLVYVE